MADIKTVTIGSTVYDIKDATAREEISDVKSATKDTLKAQYDFIKFPFVVPIATGGITETGANLTDSTNARTNYIPILEGRTYRFYLNGSGYSIVRAWVSSGKTAATAIRELPLNDDTSFVFRAGTSEQYFRVSFKNANDPTAELTSEDFTAIANQLNINYDGLDSLASIENELVSRDLSYEQGGLRPSTGATLSSTTRVRSTIPIRTCDVIKNGICTISVADGFGANVLCYKSTTADTGSYVGSLFSTFMHGTLSFIPNTGLYDPDTGDDYYFFVTIARDDENATITPSDVDRETIRFIGGDRPLHGKYRNNTYGKFRRIRFYVNVDNSNYSGTLNKVQRMCILQLPETYTPTGQPTPLVMISHGSSIHISDSGWGSTNFNNMIDQFCANGYALFDVDNTLGVSASDEPIPDDGCPALMQTYLSAWDYIKNHYNVTDDICILSNSMGTYAALNMLKWYGSHIRTAILCAPRVSIGEFYNRSSTTSTQKSHISSVFGWPSGVTNYEDAAQYMLGWDDYPEVYTENSTLKVDRKFPPIKVFVGTTDTTGLTQVREYFQGLKNSGNVVDYSETDTSTAQPDAHTYMCYLMGSDLMADGIRWLNRFWAYDNSSLT